MPLDLLIDFFPAFTQLLWVWDSDRRSSSVFKSLRDCGSLLHTLFHSNSHLLAFFLLPYLVSVVWKMQILLLVLRTAGSYGHGCHEWLWMFRLTYAELAKDVQNNWQEAIAEL